MTIITESHPILGQYHFSTSIPHIEDLSCHNVIVKQLCIGSLQIITVPSGADIYIYDDIQEDYILRSEKTGTIDDPTIIPNLECNSITRSNKFKLSLSGYVDIEGILNIKDNTIYQLYIILEPTTYQCHVTEAGGFAIPLLAAGLLLFALLGDKKKKKIADYEKYKEIYE